MYYDGVNVNNNKVKEFNFDLKKILKTYRKIENIELKLLLRNYNSNDSLNSNFLSIFFQIT